MTEALRDQRRDRVPLADAPTRSGKVACVSLRAGAQSALGCSPQCGMKNPETIWNISMLTSFPGVHASLERLLLILLMSPDATFVRRRRLS
jgi:hypothetical protein